MKDDTAHKKAQDEEIELLDSHVRELQKHWDSVQIFCNRTTRPEDISVGRDQDNTLSLNLGGGNF